MRFVVASSVPFDAAAPPQDAWGPMLVIALVVLLVVVSAIAMILGYGRVNRRGERDGRTPAETSPAPAEDTGGGPSSQATSSDDELPTDPV